MPLSLIPILPGEDPSKEIYASEDCQTLLTAWEAFYPTIGHHPPWTGYFIMENEKVMGSCAIIKLPGSERAEISYWTFKEHEGRGLASWACGQLISIARSTDPGLEIFAKTAPGKNASTVILERNGFVFNGVVQDHEIGDAWEFTLGR